MNKFPKRWIEALEYPDRILADWESWAAGVSLAEKQLQVLQSIGALNEPSKGALDEPSKENFFENLNLIEEHLGSIAASLRRVIVQPSKECQQEAVAVWNEGHEKVNE